MKTRLSGQRTAEDAERLVTREWLVTNGLGGYASGTVPGVITRRYHGLLVAALPAPAGRTVMLNQLSEEVLLHASERAHLGGEEFVGRGLMVHSAAHLAQFSLDIGLPVWRYEMDGVVLEKRVLMPHGHNTVHVSYRLVEGDGPVTLRLQPAVHFRPYEAPVSTPLEDSYTIHESEGGIEIWSGEAAIPLRLTVVGADAEFTRDEKHIVEIVYRVEESRGYEAAGDLWCPGYYSVELTRSSPAILMASVEGWNTLHALKPAAAVEAEYARRNHLLHAAPPRDRVGAQLVLAADQFIIEPATRVGTGDARTIIAGYHWFTDWGRDTMISLEGLTLVTGRHREAAYILRTFAHHVRDGLIPNMFPDHATEGLYHTADATLWFLHAIDRYVEITGDDSLVYDLMPVLRSILDAHRNGTLFGIHVDPTDGLLVQGADGYQLTWMDAKCDGWVVTPRRGKAVEINALWYNALRVMEKYARREGDENFAVMLAGWAAQTRASFNQRFWSEERGHLYDVVDGADGDDPACRPNQVFAISLPHPVLAEEKWRAVMDVVEQKLLTPCGLRSLAPDHPEYRRNYHGDLRTRDAAYHQGTVWGWLIGPFIDAWLKVHPARESEAARFLNGLVDHIDEFGVGSIAEVFDAEDPFTPRGCIAQAWSVAEVLRCWTRLRGSE